MHLCFHFSFVQPSLSNSNKNKGPIMVNLWCDVRPIKPRSGMNRFTAPDHQGVAINHKNHLSQNCV